MHFYNDFPHIHFYPPIDQLVELSVHKVTLKPVSAHLYSSVRIFRSNDGSLERLQSNLCVLEKNGVEELG